MSPELKGFIIGATIPLIGIVINAVVQLVNSRQQRKTDNEIKYREALFKLAFDYWQNESPRRTKPVPLEEYMVRMDSMYAIFIEERPSQERVDAKLRAFNLLREQWEKYDSSP